MQGLGIGRQHMDTCWGWVVIDKERLQSSMGVTVAIKRLFQSKKAGHAGTLDPLATGILPIALGGTTRLIPFLMAEDKTYIFTVAWGQATTTDDCLGEVCATCSQVPDGDQIEALLPCFRGVLSQMPPRYCAAKIQGKPAYARARKGEEFVLSAKPISIFSLEILAHDGGRTTFRTRCSTGTYVRSLARDMGEALGIHGHVVALRREQMGLFTHGHSLDTFITRENRQSFLYAPQAVLQRFPVYNVTAEERHRIWQGKAISPSSAVFSEVPKEVVVCCDGERLVALCQYSGGELTPSHCFLGEP